MAKVNYGIMPPRTLPKAKGAFYTRMTEKFGAVACKWPLPRRGVSKGYNKTPYQFYSFDEFALVGQLTASPSLLDFLSALHLSKDGVLTWRDIITMAMMGTLYEFHFAGGISSTPMRQAAPNPQIVWETFAP